MVTMSESCVSLPETYADSLYQRLTPGSRISPGPEGGLRLEIPAGAGGIYRWAQLDDYLHLARKNFCWQVPVHFAFRARVSGRSLPGTWGFGMWNDPFNASLGMGGSARRLPALPNCAWFFYGSAPNFLTIRNDLPGCGFLAGVFSSPLIPSIGLAPGLLAMPLLAWPRSARWLRRLTSRLIKEDSVLLNPDVTQWHDYRLEAGTGGCRFWIDGQMVFATALAPRGRLGLVVWVDNQFAAFPPDGRLNSGMLPNELPAWMDIYF